MLPTERPLGKWALWCAPVTVFLLWALVHMLRVFITDMYATKPDVNPSILYGSVLAAVGMAAATGLVATITFSIRALAAHRQRGRVIAALVILLLPILGIFLFIVALSANLS